MEIRWLIMRDMPEVLDIERLVFEVPWTEDDFREVLRQRNCIGMVAEDQGHVIGYMIYALHKQYLELLNFAVNPVCWRLAVGTAMVDKLKRKLGIQKRKAIVAAVRETNLAAQMFFKAMGFRCEGMIEKAWGDEPAYYFEFHLRDVTNPFCPQNRITEFLRAE